MHHYPFNIGDYRKDTCYLSITEHGIYRLLIDTYYLTELPLSLDHRELCRLHCIRSEDERAALENILADFFTKTESGYIHTGCQKVLSKIYEKSEKARQSAERKWQIERAKKSERMKKECERNANARETDANALKIDALDMLPITHNPIPKDIEACASVDSKNLHEEIQSLYNSICTDLPKCQNLSDKRKKRLSAQFKKSVVVKGNKYRCDDLDFWEKYFYLVHSIDWLNGRGDKKFSVDFEYVIREENIIKFCEAAI